MIYVGLPNDEGPDHNSKAYHPESAFLAFALGDLANGAVVKEVEATRVVVQYEGVDYAYVGAIPEMAPLVKLAEASRGERLNDTYEKNERIVLRRMTETFGVDLEKLKVGARIRAMNQIVRDQS